MLSFSPSASHELWCLCLNFHIFICYHYSYCLETRTRVELETKFDWHDFTCDYACSSTWQPIKMFCAVNDSLMTRSALITRTQVTGIIANMPVCRTCSPHHHHRTKRDAHLPSWLLPTTFCSLSEPMAPAHALSHWTKIPSYHCRNCRLSRSDAPLDERNATHDRSIKHNSTSVRLSWWVNVAAVEWNNLKCNRCSICFETLKIQCFHNKKCHSEEPWRI